MAVEPRGTSTTCPRCGARLREAESRWMRCGKCGFEGAEGVCKRLACIRPFQAHAGGKPPLDAPLGAHLPTGEVTAPGRIRHRLRLGEPDRGVVVGRPQHQRHPAACPLGKEEDGGPVFRKPREHACGKGEIALNDDPFQKFQRQAGAPFARFADGERLTVNGEFQGAVVQHEGGHVQPRWK